MILDDRPVIAYPWQNGNSLRFAACNDPQCTSATISTLDTGLIGYFSSLAILDGKPVISYMKWDNGASLHVASCLDAACSAPPILSTVDDDGNVGYSSAIAIVDGKPIISYINADTRDLKVAACVDTTRSVPAIITRLDQQAHENKTAIITIDGKAVIAYGSRTPQDNVLLRLATCTDYACTSAAITTLDDSSRNVGNFPSMVELNGFPLISYNDEVLLKVKVYYGGDYTIPVVTPTQPSQATPLPAYPTVRTINLNWSAIDWAAGYTLQIDTDAAFPAPIINDDTIPSDQLDYQPDFMLPNGIYFWRVCAKIDATTCGNWSVPESFTISAPY